MEKELAAGKIGEKGSYKLEFKAGKLVGAVMVDTSVVDVELAVKLDGEPVVLAVFEKLDEVAKKIPGPFDDMAIAALKTAVLEAIKK